jgi:hypothetical protein
MHLPGRSDNGDQPASRGRLCGFVINQQVALSHSTNCLVIRATKVLPALIERTSRFADCLTRLTRCEPNASSHARIDRKEDRIRLKEECSAERKEEHKQWQSS